METKRHFKNLVVGVKDVNVVSFTVSVDNLNVKGIGYYMFNPCVIIDNLDISVRTFEGEEVEMGDEDYMNLIEDVTEVVCERLEGIVD